MRIGDVAQATGISRDTLRFYEKRGLLRARRHANGYRDYEPEAVQWLTYIRTAQALGFTLAEIEADLPLLADPAASSDAIRAALRGKLAEIDRRIAGLAALRGELERRVELAPDDCPLRPAPQAASAANAAA
ncbi:DNA-binding transcriptional MerR regulator [Pseudoduganella flava]|uniref:DNA-binding transcriptional MerR regulator n=1 Tax=Pseudoduganella flava TaxID=871742 RepID=A0A562PEI2_9BURK|nr:MerR family transcriptional regulator [Pseudoduganella flava]QGZ38775.1 MerR family transcriptional regulator [Pseudoduganella flava]TWI42827.1 DNA-binding transcriptional MerR regulator [Pseudoduganella flava]